MAEIFASPGQTVTVTVIFSNGGPVAIGDTWWRTVLVRGSGDPIGDNPEDFRVRTGRVNPGDRLQVTPQYQIPGDWGRSIITIRLDMEMYDTAGAQVVKAHSLRVWDSLIETPSYDASWIAIESATPTVA